MSAIQVLKQRISKDESMDLIRTVSASDGCSGLLRVYFEKNGMEDVKSKAFPLAADTTASKMIRIITQKLKIEDPGSYCLWEKTESEIKRIAPQELLQVIKTARFRERKNVKIFFKKIK